MNTIIEDADGTLNLGKLDGSTALVAGHELQETTGTGERKAAQEYHDARKAEIWRIAKLGDRSRYTWKEAMVRWLDERPDHRGRDNLLGYLRRIDPLFGELPPHLAAMTRFSLATGLREVNVVGLEWAQVDLAQRRAWIHADQVKSG